MSYLRNFEYTIVPEDSYQIIRNCSVCKGKSIFASCGKFRLNANGNRIDVWLIYQCKKCKHTYNLTIYERRKADNFLPGQIKGFMENDKALAKKYGTDKSLFVRNKAEVDWSSIKYQIINNKNQQPVTENMTAYKSGDCIQISNPFGLNIRADKIIADILSLTRSRVKQRQKDGEIEIAENRPDNNINITIYGDI